MGAKKKGGKGKGKGGKKKGAQPEEEDLSMEKFMAIYTKKCKELDIVPSKVLKEKYEFCLEEGEKITKIHLWEELGWVGTRAIMDALKQVQ